MNNETVIAILGPRYAWAINTEPVIRLMDYITILEEKLGILSAIKHCECPPEPPSRSAPTSFVNLPGHVHVPTSMMSD